MELAEVVVPDADKSPVKPSENSGDNGKEDPNRKKANSKRHCEGYNQRVIFKDPIGSFNLNGVYGPVVYPPEPSQPPFRQIPNPPPKSSNAPLLAPIAPKPPQHLGYHGQSVLQYGQGFPGQLPLHQQPSPPFDFNQLPFGHSQMPPTPSSTLPISPESFQGPFAGIPHSIVSPSTDDGAFPAGPSSVWGRLPPGHERVEEVGVFPEASDPLGRNDVMDESEIQYAFSDDDASMADSEDAFDGLMAEGSAYGQLVQTRSSGPWEGYGTKPRSFSAFADEYTLTSYIPTPNNSPLNDDRTAALFWHFISVTGPSMSLYERHPFDHAKLMNNYSVPKAGHNIWTYTFPILAFNHPALLQAMLALGALQIAKLQQVPPTAAMKHYHLSIRRIAKNVRSVKRRSTPATLAATLLLGYFEVWNSDHTKWCNHLWGARVLIKEIPFRRWTTNILPLKRARRALFKQSAIRQSDPFYMGHDNTHMMSHDLDDLDLDLLGRLTSLHVSYEDEAPTGSYYTDRDIEHYEHLRDLYWWYLWSTSIGHSARREHQWKFGAWSVIEEQGVGGTPDASLFYGTYDHLMLLLGRLCTFVSKDLARKRKAFKGFGPPGAQRKPPNEGGPPDGQGWPPPGMASGMPGGPPPDLSGMGGGPRGPQSGMLGAPPGGPGGPPPGMMSSGLGGPGASPPMFPGMLPNMGKATLPMGFSPPRDESPQPSETTEDLDTDAAEEAATREWQSLREAFEVLRARFGPAFQPLGAEYADNRASPFGLTLQYRTFSVAGIWMNFYMGLIHLYRAHPKMPPAAMIAAGIQAQHTLGFAMEIGRIAAGLTEDMSAVTEISPLVGAALIESSFCLFVGAIQYQDDAQRHWLVRRMHDIARLTGWQSARQIAEGCESGWKKAAAMGRGPTYDRDPSLHIVLPSSVWTNPRRRIGDKIEELDSDDKLLVVAKAERAHYALGLLSVEQELDRLVIREEEN
ncbi:hypothetical protein CTRI78_v003651 [Colletotrichum trifolii]|uniref:Transcription factor domain-containing protein n=1 Tax=Colletotrichum trifolii TaxID=5466 RepID=A0A4R8RIZ7_COLTR|nr:hypothetical protein CTRI78_v003651 [Colletotrichum trifolii]